MMAYENCIALICTLPHNIKNINLILNLFSESYGFSEMALKTTEKRKNENEKTSGGLLFTEKIDTASKCSIYVVF